MSDVRHRRDRDAVLERDVFELLRNRVSRCDVLLNRADADAPALIKVGLGSELPDFAACFDPSLL